MGKSIPSTTHFQEIARRIISNKTTTPKSSKLVSRFRVINKTLPHQQKQQQIRGVGGLKKMDVSEGSQQNQHQEHNNSNNNNNNNINCQRIPLEDVVADCVKRWFDDTLKEAKSGDTVMQVLVGQMYYNGYGVPRDPQKGRAWITRASKSRSSVWRVCDKRPGYVASDSDSDDVNADPK